MYCPFCFFLNTNILGLYLSGKNAWKSVPEWYLIFRLIELLIRCLLQYCGTKRNHTSTMLWSFFSTKAYFAIQYSFVITNNYVETIHSMLSWFAELQQYTFLSKTEENSLFRYLQKYGHMCTVEWVQFWLRFCLLQFTSGSCWPMSVVQQEDMSNHLFPKCRSSLNHLHLGWRYLKSLYIFCRACGLESYNDILTCKYT